MIKKIITLVVCLALCVSCIAVGVVNQTAKDSSIDAAANGTIEGISAAPEGATQVGGELYEKDGVYYLNGDVTITRENAKTNPTYLALLENFEVTDASATAKILDGNNNTITTEIPLFKGISNCTIRNLTVNGGGENGTITLTDDDIYDAGTKFGYKTGVIAAIVYTSNANASGTEWVKFENVTVNANLTYGSAEKETKYGHVSAAGFVGGGEHYSKLSFKNCVNNGDVTVYTGAAATDASGNEKRAAACGLFGIGVHCQVEVDGCVNTGDMNVTVCADRGLLVAVGLVGSVFGGSGKITFSNSVNTGDVTANANYDTVRINARLGGLLGRTGGLAGHTAENCINLGDVTLNSTTTKAQTGGGIRMGGVFADFSGSTTVNNCINFGDVTNGVAFAQPTGGVLGYSSSGSYTNMINLGRVEIATEDFQSFGYVIGHCGEANPTVGGNYYVLPTNVKNEGYKFDSADNGYGEKNNGPALAAATRITNETFSTVATAENNKFTTSIDTTFYDVFANTAANIKAAGVKLDFEFGAIIAPAKYDEVIPGDFTHETFDAYLKANKTTNAKLTNIDALYMTAKFANGESLELDDDAYKANVTLKNAYATAYIARTYIKIGDAYVYSK